MCIRDSCTPVKPEAPCGISPCTASSSGRRGTAWTSPSPVAITSEASLIWLCARALDAAGTLRSRRAADDLRELRLGQPHKHLTDVAELRHRIGMAVAAVAGVCLTRHERAPGPL